MNDTNIAQAEYYLEQTRSNFPELRKVFDKLSSGDFINKNSNDLKEIALYRSIYNNPTIFKKYFYTLGFELIIENGYCYFTNRIEEERDENASSRDNPQINKILNALVIFNFFKTILNNFGTIEGFEFNISTLEDAVNSNAEYRDLIPSKSKDPQSNRKSIESMLSSFQKFGYIDEVEKKEGRYKTLSSLDYLKNILSQITLEDE